MRTMIAKSDTPPSFYICEKYPHPINEMRFGGEWSALEYAKRHYGLPADYLFGSNGMGYLFYKDGEWKGFRILIE